VATDDADAPLKVDEQLAAYSIRRPDLAAHGLTFVGGDALQGGEAPAIRLVYADDADRRVFLFVGTVGSGADVALTVVPEGHVSLNWRRGNLVFALIGPKDSDQLLDVMAATSDLLAPAAGHIVPEAPSSGVSGVMAGNTDAAATPQAGAAMPEVGGTGTPVDQHTPDLPVTPAIMTETVSKQL
jgi:hypothetical protein